jgi:quercetin dioxygenase-like cupin family protein
MDTLKTLICDWDKIPPEPTKTGMKRPFLRGKTATLDQLSCHVTTLNPGEKAHEPHRHPEEEMILLKEGTLEALVEDKRTTMSAGSLLFIAPQDLHGVTNTGKTPATYYVIKWWPPGMIK